MWPNAKETTDLVKITEEVFDGKLYFLFSVKGTIQPLLNAQCDVLFKGAFNYYPTLNLMFFRLSSFLCNGL